MGHYMRSKIPVLNDILSPDANNFGAIRLAMALAVLVSHSYWLATGQPALEPLHTWTHHSLGEHAVQVFFFLSGVVVTIRGHALRLGLLLLHHVLLHLLLLLQHVHADGPEQVGSSRPATRRHAPRQWRRIPLVTMVVVVTLTCPSEDE